MFFKIKLLVVLLFFISDDPVCGKAPEFKQNIVQSTVPVSLTLTQTAHVDPLDIVLKDASDLALTQDQGQTQEAYFLYTLGHYQKNNCDPKALNQLFTRLAEMDFCSEFTSDLLVKHFFSREEFNKITELMIWDKDTYHVDEDVLLMAACAFEATGNMPQAEKIFSHLEKDFSDNEQIVYHSALRLMKLGKFDVALARINKFLGSSNLRSRHASFFSLKAFLIETIKKNPENVLTVINEGLALNPRHEALLKMKYAHLLKLSAQKDFKESDELIKTLNQLAAISSDDGYRQLLINHYFTSKKYKAALQEVLHLKPKNFSEKMSKMILLVKLKRYKKAIIIADSMILEQPENQKIKDLRFQLLYEAKMYDLLSSELCLRFKKNMNDKGLFAKILLVMRSCSNQELIIKQLLELISTSKDFMYKMALADFCFTNQFYGEASNLYQDLKNLISGENVIKLKILCAEAKIHLKVGNQFTGQKTLEALIRICPNLYPAWKFSAEYAFSEKEYDKAIFFVQQAHILNPLDKELITLYENTVKKLWLNDKISLFSFLLEMSRLSNPLIYQV